MRRFRHSAAAMVLVAVVAAACSSPPDTPGGTTAAVSVVAPPWRLSWSDEFDGPAGQRPDPAHWVFQQGGEPQWGNQEWQYYTDRPENVSTDGAGHLAITARREQLPGMTPCENGTCDITSGRITTKGKFDQAYGRFEAGIKIPAGTGIWPAFWMLGSDEAAHPYPANGEIDIMENVGDQPETVFGTVHSPGEPREGYSGKLRLPDGQQLADAFHAFAVEWGPTQITWLLDGRPYHAVFRDSMTKKGEWVFDHPFYLLLNLAVGGVWPGPPDKSTVFPATMSVDYVRVYTK